VLSCQRLRSATTARHDKVVDGVVRAVREFNVGAREKPRFKPAHAMGRVEIPDLEGRVRAGRCVCVHSSNVSVSGRIDEAVKERVAEKQAKYDRAMAMAGATDKVAFVVEGHGAISGDADYTELPIYHVRDRMADVIAIAIQRGNAQLVSRAGQLTDRAELL
jgi:hypothetical protein